MEIDDYDIIKWRQYPCCLTTSEYLNNEQKGAQYSTEILTLQFITGNALLVRNRGDWTISGTNISFRTNFPFWASSQ